MTMSNDEKIERLIRGALSGLPPRRAPEALQQRVLDELTLRAALPWWRRNFAQWPLAARTGFVLLGVLLAGLSLKGGFTHQIDAQGWWWAHQVSGVLTAIGGVASLAVSLVPPLFIYIVLILGALLYVSLFGLGAVAYRTLYLQHSNTAMIRS